MQECASKPKELIWKLFCAWFKTAASATRRHILQLSWIQKLGKSFGEGHTRLASCTRRSHDCARNLDSIFKSHSHNCYLHCMAYLKHEQPFNTKSLLSSTARIRWREMAQQEHRSSGSGQQIARILYTTTPRLFQPLRRPFHLPTRPPQRAQIRPS